MRTLQKASLDSLTKILGSKNGAKLRDYAFGRDSRMVKSGPQKPKSLGVDLTYGVRFTEAPAVLDFIAKIATEVHNRLKSASLKGNKVCTGSIARLNY